MFVLDELDNILQNLVPETRKKNDTNRIRISLNEIERLNVGKMQLALKVPYPIRSAIADLTAGNRIAKLNIVENLMSSERHLTTDALFVLQISPLILPGLADTMERQYPWAKLIICDRLCYEMLLKLNRIWFKNKHQQTGDMTNFLFKPPFNITAIFLLPDIVDLIDRERKPIVIVDSRRRANFNYSLIKQLFPYLKLSNLTVLLKDKGKLQLGTFTIDAPREHQVLQFVCHFARGTQVIELNSIVRSMGNFHLMYDKVLVIPASNIPVYTNDDGMKLINNRPTLTHLSSMANQLVHLTEKLRLNLLSVTYRAGDPFGQTKLFSQMVITCLSSRRIDFTAGKVSAAKVIVLDRFYDLQSALYHADSYGAFMEQEKDDRLSSNSRMAKFRMDSIDELDDRLQLVQLTEVLAETIKYSTRLRTKELSNPVGSKGQNRIAQISDLLSSALTTNQSIRRHLDMIKLIYRCLNDGYLLLLRLESSLKSLYSELRGLNEPLSQPKQLEMAGRVDRIGSVFKQLTKTTGNSITTLDMIRVACILIDVLNTYLSIHNRREGHSKDADTTINDILQWVMSSSEFKKALNSRLSKEQDSGSSSDLIQLMAKFNKVSREAYGQKCALSMEQIINKLQTKQNDHHLFPTMNLQDKQSESRVVVLVFLGAMTPHELSKIKSLEANLKSSQLLDDMYLLTCGLVGPEDYLRAF